MSLHLLSGFSFSVTVINKHLPLQQTPFRQATTADQILSMYQSQPAVAASTKSRTKKKGRPKKRLPLGFLKASSHQLGMEVAIDAIDSSYKRHKKDIPDHKTSWIILRNML